MNYGFVVLRMNNYVEAIVRKPCEVQKERSKSHKQLRSYTCMILESLEQDIAMSGTRVFWRQVSQSEDQKIDHSFKFLIFS